MRNLQISRIHLILLLLLAAVIGCNKTSSIPEPLTIEQFPSAFEKAFRTAKSDVKDLATEVVSAARTNGYGQAYTSLQSLSTIPTLTKEQSSVVARGMLTLNGLLQSAAAKGDENAAQAMQAYRLQK